MGDIVLVYNIALNALLINYQTSDPLTDNEKSVRTLRTFYPLALSKVLADLDLNRTATKVKLELRVTAEDDPHWDYVYKYPTSCAKLRRLVSALPIDNQETRIPYITQTVEGVDSILTNDVDSYAEIIPTTAPLSTLNPNAIAALGTYLAYMSCSLITGKGAKDLKQSIMQDYMMFKAEAMEDDQNENVDTTPDEFKSEFAQARLGGKKWHSRI